jgi:hypothetical protein
MRLKSSFKQKLISFIGGALIGITALTSNVKAESKPIETPTQNKPVETPTQDYSARLRTEVDAGEGTTFFKNTLGITKFDEKGYNKFNEFFRAYNFTGEQNGQHIDYTNLGAILPRFSIGSLENEVAIFGMVGDKEAKGFQSRHFFDGLTFTANAETLDQKGENPGRIGAGADYKIGNLTPGLGMDRINNSKGITDYFTNYLIIDAAKTDLIGLTSKLASGDEDKNCVGALYLHYGPQETWGTRTRGTYSWDNNEDSRAFSFQSIINQNPAFSRASGALLVGRTLGETFSSQLYSEIPPFNIERTPLGERSRGGWGIGIDGTFKDVAGKESGYLKTEIVHTASSDNWRRSFSGFYETSYGLQKDKCVGASIFLGKGKNLDFEVIYKHPIQGDKNPSVYFSLMKAF